MNRLASFVLAPSLILLGNASAQVVFSESFESPIVTGFTSNTVPFGGN